MAFTYKIIANPTGSRAYRGAVDSKPTIDPAVFLAEVATNSGKDAATVAAVLDATFGTIQTHVLNAENIGPVRGIFRVFATCGGGYTTATPPPGDVAKTVSFNVTPTAEFIAALQAGLTMEKTGESGLLAPQIEGVTTLPGGIPNAFKPAEGLEIRGLNLRGRNAAVPIVQLINIGGGPAITLLVLEASDTRLVCSVPASGFDGACTLQVTAPYGSDTRTGVYSEDLTKLA